MIRRSWMLLTAAFLMALLQSAPAAAQVGIKSTTPNVATLQATLDSFLEQFAGLDHGTGGTFKTGSRSLTWDDVPDALASPTLLPGDYFNTAVPRGVIMSTPGTGFVVSQDDDTGGDADPDLLRFDDIVPGYSAMFPTLSPQRLMAVRSGSTVTTLSFRVPGTNIPGYVRMFAIVFLDVDDAAGTKIEFLDGDGVVFQTEECGSAGVANLIAFVFETPRIADVRITAGNGVLGTVDGPGNDVVAIDNIIFGEPQPASIEFKETTNYRREEFMPIDIAVWRSGPTTAPASAQVVITGRATPGVDYTATPTAIEFAPGQSEAVIALTMVDDAAYEGMEDATWTLSNLTPGYASGLNDRFIALINDNDMLSPNACGTTDSNALKCFNLRSPYFTGPETPIVGLQPGEFLYGLDARPSTGELYALSSGDRLYRLTPGDVETVATMVGGGPISVSPVDPDFGFDFDPVTDQIRVVTPGRNFRLNPDTAASIADTPPQFAPGDVNEGQGVEIVALAYTNSVPGAASATLYGYERLNNCIVKFSSSPETGLITTVRTLDALPDVDQAVQRVGFDIMPGTNYAFLVYNERGLGDQRFFLVDLTTGQERRLGELAGNDTDIYYSFAIIPHGVLRLTGAPAVTAEGGVAQVMVERVGGTASAMQATLAIAGGTATPGLDFVNPPLPILFADGEVGPKAINIATNDDGVYEPDETVNVSVRASPVELTGTPSAAAVTILASDSPSFTISDTASIEGDFGSANLAVFTVTASNTSEVPLTIDYATADGTAIANTDYQPASGTLTFDPGVTMRQIHVPIIGDIFNEAAETFTATLSNAAAGSIVDDTGSALITNDDASALTYYFAEGATGSFFDTTLALANTNAQEAPITLKFLLANGAPPISIDRVLPAQSRSTIRVDDLPGLENQGGVSVVVTSTAGLPLAVDRTMTWDTESYGSHSAAATNAPSQTWYFAEGVQNGAGPQTGSAPYFDTFLLLTNTQNVGVTATIRFLLEPAGVVIKAWELLPNERLTIYAGDHAELVGRTFAMSVAATAPILAERSTYFGGARLWDGGHNSAGVPAPSSSWFMAEGATGPFFETFLAIANPNVEAAHVTVTYLRQDGASVVKDKVLAPSSRLTVNLETEDAALANADVATIVSSDRPVVAERMMYWPDPFVTWNEAHSSFGATEPGLSWGMAEGRVGQAAHYDTYVLVANPNDAPANITATFYRTAGAPIVKPFAIAANSRFTLKVNALVPELANEAFSTRIDATNGQPVFVEGAVYWDALGVTWASGTAMSATRLP